MTDSTEEHSIQNEIRIAAARVNGLILSRNNVGKAYVGGVTRFGPDVYIKKARILHAGLCEGSSDLIGIREVQITPDMVGKTIGAFVAIEVETKDGRTHQAQRNFIQTVGNHGGIVRIMRGPDDLGECAWIG